MRFPLSERGNSVSDFPGGGFHGLAGDLQNLAHLMEQIWLPA